MPCGTSLWKKGSKKEPGRLRLHSSPRPALGVLGLEGPAGVMGREGAAGEGQAAQKAWALGEKEELVVATARWGDGGVSMREVQGQGEAGRAMRGPRL